MRGAIERRKQGVAAASAGIGEPPRLFMQRGKNRPHCTGRQGRALMPPGERSRSLRDERQRRCLMVGPRRRAAAAFGERVEIGESGDVR